MKYKTLYADPPWNERGGGKVKRGADKHYNLMKSNDILTYFKTQIFPLLDDDCHFYLWVTNNFLEDGLELMRQMGFVYKTNIVWVKNHIGLGQYFRGIHEICLFGTRGKFTSNSNKESTMICSKKGKHSRKPHGMYSKIEAVSDSPRLEVFARDKREGWDVFGDESPVDTQKILRLA